MFRFQPSKMKKRDYIPLECSAATKPDKWSLFVSQIKFLKKTDQIEFDVAIPIIDFSISIRENLTCY